MVLAAAAGAFHVLATVEHFAESVLYGVVFAVAATGQLAWAAWIYRRPHTGPRSLTVGAAGNLAVAPSVQPSGRWAGRLAGLTADQQTQSYLALITATVVALLIGSQQH